LQLLTGLLKKIQANRIVPKFQKFLIALQHLPRISVMQR